ncbi:LCP family protein [Patescibacteria group bacterium]|nr:LCP family protein [Patescibacteria group bacterium]MBU1015829.1 LCP family protein [Patescibacteria group bacterium]MBU1685275.1 LCP family protein [Patescibacteria group bacterium]MBU1938472.1 LCP family protein [Patescibacteria group bacterium]
MTFKTRQIRRRPSLKLFKKTKHLSLSFIGLLRNLPPKTKNYLAAGLLVIFGIFVVVKVTGAAYNLVVNFNPKEMIFAVGSDLKKDEHGYTNILLLGDGGHERDGADLIDTIMVASIDYEKNAVSLFSIPRDFYVQADNERGIIYSGKINELYRNHKNVMEDEEDRFQLFKRAAGEIVNLDIQYYVRLDFNAFVDVIDSLGGIMVDVQEDIYDPYYPNETDDGYTIFSVKKGLQDMDGETALKFVRSRKTTSDFDRALRQQLVIDAVQQKALSKEILTSPGKLKDLYYAVEDNVNTDMGIRELIELAGFGKKLDRSHLVRKVIHDDPGQEGGFLYTPERELYGGQFVLIPFGGDYELIHKYADLVFHQREIFYEPAKIEILNATKLSGIARNAAYQLIRFGFDVEEIDNYYDPNDEKAYLTESIIEYHDYTEDAHGLIQPKYQTTLNALDSFVKAGERASRSAHMASEEGGKKIYKGGRINLSVILGDDYDVFQVN